MMVSGIGRNDNYFRLYNSSYNYKVLGSNANQKAVAQVDGVISSNRYNHHMRNTMGNFSTGMNKEMQGFLKQYRAQYSELQNAARSLSAYGAQSVWQENSGSSSDEAVLAVNNSYNSRLNGHYEIDVQQLATAQSNNSVALPSEEVSNLTADRVHITMGDARDYVVNIAGHSVDGVRKTNDQVLTELAAGINQQKMGVTAQVIRKDEKSRLEISGDLTGAKQTFQISSETGFVGDLKIYQPDHAAQNALYTLRKQGQEVQLRESATNEVALDSYRVGMTLQKVGQATVSFGTNGDKIKGAVQDLVGAYNDTIKMLDKNSERGAGILKQMRALMMPPISEQTMASVGLTYDKAGLLNFDEKAFEAAYATNAAQTKDVLGGQYSVADGFIQDTQKALQEESYTLIDKAMAQNDQVAESFNKEYAYLQNFSGYSRAGAYNLMNFAYMSHFLNMRV